jgi:FkbM family methyltransferase
MIMRRLGPLTAGKFLMIAAAQSRPFSNPFLLRILDWIARKRENRIYYDYQINRSRMRGFLRRQHIWSDFQSAMELAVGDCYQLSKLSEPDLIIDGGANTGLFCLAALAQWPSAHIVAIEPLHDNIIAIRGHLELNSLSNKVDIRQAALSTGFGLASFYIRDANQGSLFENAPASACIEVKTIPISGCIPDRPGMKILIKLDVEGAEVDILKQLFSIRTSIKDIQIVMELHEIQRNRPLIEDLASNWDASIEFYQVGSQTAHCRLLPKEAKKT